MNSTRRTLLIAALLVLGAIAVWFMRPHSPTLPSATLPDGTQIIVQAVSYGTNHTFVHGSEILGKIQKHIPFARRWLPPMLAMTMFTAEEYLVVWYSAYDPRTQKYVSPAVDRLSVIDEHGCIFSVNHFGPKTTAGFSVSSAYVSAFPRRQRTFIFRAKFQNYPPVDLQIANPLFPVTTPNWKPEPLPATRTTNNLAVTLIALQPNPERSYISALFHIYEDGVYRGEWYSKSTSFRDVTGNNITHLLCPYERAWKVDVDFYKTAKAPFPESAIWRVPNLAIPKAGEILTLTNENQFGELKIKAMALCGAGGFSFSNEVFLFSAPWQKGWGESFNFMGTGMMDFRSEKPSLIVRVDGWKRSEELLIRAQAPDGTAKSFQFRGSGGKVCRYELEQGSSGELLHLEFIPQQPVHFEFTVQPPRP